MGAVDAYGRTDTAGMPERDRLLPTRVSKEERDMADTEVPSDATGTARRSLLARLPLWVRISAITALVLVAVFAASMALGVAGIGGEGGGHGGGGHGSGTQMQRTDRGGGGHVSDTDHDSERSPGTAGDHGTSGSGGSHDSAPGR